MTVFLFQEDLICIMTAPFPPFQKKKGKKKKLLSLYCAHSFKDFYIHQQIVWKVDLKPFPKQQILDTSKLKGFADNNFKFYENSI